MKLQTLSLLSLSLLAGALLLSACTSSASSTNTNAPPMVNGHAIPPGADGIPRIALADAKLVFDKGEALFVDTRDAGSYSQEHIKGAINIPMAEAETRASELPKGRLLIAYCS